LAPPPLPTPPDEATTTLFVSSEPEPDTDNEDDRPWREAFADQQTSPEHRCEQQLHLQKGELERFMSDSLETLITAIIDGKITRRSMVDKPLRWWRECSKHLYPTLAAMAYDLFSIPVMSRECERTFSAGKRLITDHRYGLKNDIIEADQCIKSWFKHGIADGAAVFTSIATLGAVDDEITEIT
jgi:hypothetical protein